MSGTSWIRTPQCGVHHRGWRACVRIASIDELPQTSPAPHPACCSTCQDLDVVVGGRRPGNGAADAAIEAAVHGVAARTLVPALDAWLKHAAGVAAGAPVGDGSDAGVITTAGADADALAGAWRGAFAAACAVLPASAPVALIVEAIAREEAAWFGAALRGRRLVAVRAAAPQVEGAAVCAGSGNHVASAGAVRAPGAATVAPPPSGVAPLTSVNGNSAVSDAEEVGSQNSPIRHSIDDAAPTSARYGVSTTAPAGAATTIKQLRTALAATTLERDAAVMSAIDAERRLEGATQAASAAASNSHSCCTQ